LPTDHRYGGVAVPEAAGVVAAFFTTAYKTSALISLTTCSSILEDLRTAALGIST
jgi:hypothetical protein